MKFQVFSVFGISIIKRGKKFILNVIYRPSHGNFSLFLQEFECLLLEFEINEGDLLYLGDFNSWIDEISKKGVQFFPILIINFYLVDFVNKPTYSSGHTLDWVTTKNHQSLEGQNSQVRRSEMEAHLKRSERRNLKCSSYVFF